MDDDAIGLLKTSDASLRAWARSSDVPEISERCREVCRYVPVTILSGFVRGWVCCLEGMTGMVNKSAIYTLKALGLHPQIMSLGQ